jgi:hypothetical protein
MKENLMLYAILCYHSEAEVNSWSKEKDDAVIAKRATAQRKLHERGKLGPVARLMPTTAAVTVRSGREPLVIDGPFAETKEALLGFYIVDCESLDAVIEVARSMLSETGAFEIRPVRTFKPSELGLDGDAHVTRLAGER